MMEPTNCSTPPPAAPGRANKRQRKAALPLGDVTNLLPNTPTPRNPSARRPVPPPSDESASACFSASVTPVSKPSPAAGVVENSLGKSAISTVYTSRKHKGRKRGLASASAPFSGGTAASCPPLGRATRSSSHSASTTPMAVGTRPISSSAPCHQNKKKWDTRMANSSWSLLNLPEDFVRKQRAYFEEVDAFELPEEEASD